MASGFSPEVKGSAQSSHSAIPPLMFAQLVQPDLISVEQAFAERMPCSQMMTMVLSGVLGISELRCASSWIGSRCAPAIRC